MPTVIDSLIVSLGLDASNFNAGQRQAVGAIKRLEGESKKTSKNMQEGGKQIAASFAKVKTEILALTTAFISLGAIKNFVERITESDAELGYLAKNIGMNTEELSAWANMAEKAGGSAEGMKSSIKGIVLSLEQFNQTAEGGEFLTYWAQAGISLVDPLTNKMRSMRDILLETADYLHSLTGPQAMVQGKGLGFDEGTTTVLWQQGRAAVAGLVNEQKRLNAANEKDALLAQRRKKEWLDLLDVFTDMGREILTNVSPAVIKLTHDFQTWVSDKEGLEWIKAVGDAIKNLFVWLDKDVNWKSVREGLSDLATFAKDATNMVGGLTNALEILFALWAGSKLAAMVTGIARLGIAIAPLAVMFGGFKAGEWINENLLSEESKASIDEAIDWADEKLAGAKKKGVLESGKQALKSGKDWIYQGLSNLVSQGEGDYNSVNLGKAGNNKASKEDLTRMTVNEVMEAQRTKRFNAAGRYQVIAPTMKSTVGKMGLTGNELFDEAMQDKIFEFLINDKKNIKDFITGKTDTEKGLHDALKSLSELFASFADPDTGKSHYEGIANNKASIFSDEAGQMLRGLREKNTGQTSNQLTVGQITINTQATDAKGIAKDIHKELANYSLAFQANRGLV